MVDGDAIMAIVARDMIQRGTLRKETLVATVMSNVGLERAVAEVGGAVVRTGVGDRYVVEEMRRRGYNFGGEQSGHLVFLDHATTGDGVCAALNLLAVMKRSGLRVSQLASCFTPSPQVQRNVTVREKRPIETLALVRAAIDDVERALGSSGRVLVRFSGTENKARVLVEGPDDASIRAHADRIAEALSRELA